MRYYVVCKSELDDIAPHIVAEVVRDHTETNKDATLASALAGDRRVIVTRTELLNHPVGLQALKAWDSEDDTVYDDEREAVRTQQDAPRRGLRLVR